MRGLNFGLSTNGKPLFQALQFWLRFQTLCDSTHFIMIQAFLESFLEIAVWLWKLQSDCGNCTLIVGLQLDCGDCSWIAEIAVWLWRLQLDCGDCSWIAEIAVWNSVVGACHTLECGHLGVSQGKILTLIVEIAVGLRRLQSYCWDWSMKQCVRCLRHSGKWTPRGKSW